MNKENNSLIDFNELIICFLSGNATDQEIELLREWIHSSRKNREEFMSLKLSWLASSQLETRDSLKTRNALSLLYHKIDLHESNTAQTYNSNFKQIAKIAAVLIFCFMLGSLGTYLSMKNNSTGLANQGLVHVYAPKCSKAMTILPDGTRVWLNAGSNLSYNINDYGQRLREVTLIGQGFFKVVSNANKPFVVSAKNLKIKALGTEFDVKAYPEENTVETILIKGIVNIEGKDQKKQSFMIKMNPNQKVTCFSGKMLLEPSILTDPAKLDETKLNQIKLEKLPPASPEKPVIDKVEKPDLYTSWKDDRWVFEGEEIGNLAILLERRYNVNIIFDSEELNHYKFTGTFQQETLEQILKVLTLTAPLRYNVGKGEVKLTIDPVLKIKYKKYMNF